MTAVKTAFDKARAEGRSALIGYLPAGFPDIDGAIDAVKAMIDNGVDIVEIGLPYSDPVMDGPVIQRATEAALANGFRVKDGLRTIEAVAGTGAPILTMTYWNLVERYGTGRFAADLAAAGGAGLITPDLIPEEAQPWLDASDAHDLDRVFLVSPSSTDVRVAMTAAKCRGFVYATSVMGVTGARSHTSSAAPALVERVRQTSDQPVAVGLGVSNGDQAAEVGAFADGVIVGSALVRCLLDASTRSAGIAAVAALSADLAEGVRRR
jgi:tryptophan synthase alpha chain